MSDNGTDNQADTEAGQDEATEIDVRLTHYPIGGVISPVPLLAGYQPGFIIQFALVDDIPTLDITYSGRYSDPDREDVGAEVTATARYVAHIADSLQDVVDSLREAYMPGVVGNWEVVDTSTDTNTNDDRGN